MSHFVIISGCSGGGKSTLLDELRRRGYRVVEEPGRRVIQEESNMDGSALPWIDLPKFLRRAADMALADFAHASRYAGEWVFFDRGLLDALTALHYLTGDPSINIVGTTHRYHPLVFMAPPWSEIYAQDENRRHDMNAALIEFERLEKIYPKLG